MLFNSAFFFTNGSLFQVIFYFITESIILKRSFFQGLFSYNTAIISSPLQLELQLQL